MSVPATWLRVVIHEIRGSDHGRSSAYLTTAISEFTRVLADQPGFVVAYWGHEPDAGTIAAVSQWRSRQAIRDADSELQELQAVAQAHGIHVVHLQNLEIFAVPVEWSTWTGGDPAGDPGADPGGDKTEATTGATWLRVVTYTHAPGDERAEHYMRHKIEDCLHVLEKQPGFQLGYWGRDLDEHTMAAVTYWSSREAIQDAEPTLRQLQAEAAAHGVHPVDVRNVRLFSVPTP